MNKDKREEKLFQAQVKEQKRLNHPEAKQPSDEERIKNDENLTELEWINEELSYEKIDPEPKARIDTLKEIKERFHTNQTKTINIRPFLKNEDYTIKLELKYDKSGHDHLHVLDQEGKTRGYFHFSKEHFSFGTTHDGIKDIFYRYGKGLI